MGKRKRKCGAIMEITGVKTLRQEEDTASETLGCSEKSNALLHDSTLAEVHTSK